MRPDVAGVLVVWLVVVLVPMCRLRKGGGISCIYSLCFQEHCLPIKKSRVERLEIKVEPLIT